MGPDLRPNGPDRDIEGFAERQDDRGVMSGVHAAAQPDHEQRPELGIIN
jgi:hypothetical protein